jgi:hypothetical protein
MTTPSWYVISYTSISWKFIIFIIWNYLRDMAA